MYMKKQLITLALIYGLGCITANAQKTLSVSVTNPTKTERKSTPVVLKLKDYGFEVK